MIAELADKSRTRGRPPGKAQVGREQGLRLHDLAFMRSVVQGQGVSAAAQRYLPEGATEGRVANQHLRRVGQVAADTLIGMGEPQTAQVVLNWLSISKSQAISTPCENETSPNMSVQTPSLDDFAEEIGAEDFSEREILALYQERYGEQQANSPGAVPPATATSFAPGGLEEVLRALGQVQSRGLLLPKLSDPVSLWFGERLANCLASNRIERLQELVEFINGRGRHWYRHISGLGQDRAKRLVAWWVDHEVYLEHAIAQRSRWDNAQAQALSVGLVPSMFAAQLEVQGAFSLRATGANAAGAQDDGQALKAWLETLSFKSPNTQVAYARDAQRLLYWARERGKGLSSLTVHDAAEHARFLLNPPAQWVEPLPTLRIDAQWRPMRGALSDASAARALAAIGHLYGFLVETGYLVANPFARLRSASSGPQGPQIDTTRSFRTAHLQLLVEVVGALPSVHAQRRARAMLMLMVSTGVRIGEMGGTWGDVIASHAEVEADGQPREALCLRVIGKGGKQRLLPLKASVLGALQRHLDDRRELEQQGLLPALPLADTPLVSVLGKPVGGELASANGALSAAGIHRVFKSLCSQAARACLDPAMRGDFERATAHWLRHTFAHAVLRASGRDLPVTQQLLGHASLATTGVYVKADMTQRVRAVLAMPLMFESSARGHT